MHGKGVLKVRAGGGAHSCTCMMSLVIDRPGMDCPASVLLQFGPLRLPCLPCSKPDTLNTTFMLQLMHPSLFTRPTLCSPARCWAAAGVALLNLLYPPSAAPLQTCAQVLLTLENLSDRAQYINARNTFTELLAYGTIPVVNENVSG